MKLIERLLSDLSAARDNHDAMMAKINGWRSDIYIKEPNESIGAAPTGKRKSKMKMKDIAKVVESSTPSIVEPFISNSELIDAKPKGYGGNSEIVKSLLNTQWSEEVDTIDLMNDIARVVQVDGSVVLKVGWMENSPTIELVPFEEVFFDPSARTINDIKYAIQARRVQIIDILNNPSWYGEYEAEELVKLVTATPDDRYTLNDYSGSDSNFNFEDGLRQFVDVYEFYGQQEVDGEVKNIVAVFSGSELLNTFDSPYPDSWNGIPFEIGQYVKRPFSIYGDSVAEMLRDYQSIRTGFMREILNNAENANSSQKWNQKGALDVVNKRKMLIGADFETNVNPQEAIVQGEFNQINPSVFQIMEQMKVEQEELSGIGRLNSGLDPRALNSGTSATAARLVQTNAERRLLMIVRSVSQLLKRTFEKMLDLNMLMLEPTTVNVFGRDVLIDRDVIAGMYNIELNVNTEGSKQAQNDNILLMVQQLQANYQFVPNAGEMINDLLAKLSANIGLNGVAQKMKLMQIQGSDQNEMMQQQQAQMQQIQMDIEMQKAQSEVAKNHSQAALNEAKAVQAHVEAQTEAYGLNQ